jgi:hypothetical protein
MLFCGQGGLYIKCCCFLDGEGHGRIMKALESASLLRYIKIFVFIGIPILLSLFWLFSPFEEIKVDQLSYEEIDNFTGIYTISEETIFKPSLKNTIRDVFSTPFDLRWYHLCLRDKGSFVTYAGEPSKEYFEISITFDDGDKILVSPSIKRDCKLLKFDTEFLFTYGIYFEGDVLKTVYALEKNYDEPVKFFPMDETYIKPEYRGIVVKSILFILSWMAICLLLTEVFKKLK